MKNNTDNNIDQQFSLMLVDIEETKDYDRAEQIEGCLHLFIQENNLAQELVERAIFLFLKLTLNKELIQNEVVRKDHFFLYTGHFHRGGYMYCLSHEKDNQTIDSFSNYCN